MRIVYMLEAAAHLWGGVKVALEGANELVARGHGVVVLSKTEAPVWMEARFRFETVPDFGPDCIPAADVIIGTDWTTVPHAVAARQGVPVHFVQSYDGCFAQRRDQWPEIDAVFRMQEPKKIAISPHLAETMRTRFGCECVSIPNLIDHRVMFPRVPSWRARNPIRVGLVGPYLIDWKDIQTGLEACRIAAESGLPLEVVRVSNSKPAPEERNQPYPVEWNVEIHPRLMGELYRSMDVFLGTSQGEEEGFFLPAVEAMASGVPCVLTDIPCFRDYGDEQYALFVPPKDPVEMAQALIVAAGHGDVRGALREAGIRTAAQYSTEAHVDALESALFELVSSSRPSPGRVLVPSFSPSQDADDQAATVDVGEPT